VLAFVALLVAVAAAHIDRLGEEAVFDLFYPKWHEDAHLTLSWLYPRPPKSVVDHTPQREERLVAVDEMKEKLNSRRSTCRP